jgi:hypothetical protein
MMNVSRANKRYAFASVDAGKLRLREFIDRQGNKALLFWRLTLYNRPVTCFAGNSRMNTFSCPGAKEGEG